MPTLNIMIATEKVDTATFKKPGQNRENLKRLARYLDSIAYGTNAASVDISDSSTAPVAASGTFTLASAIAGDAITIGQETFTASSTPSGENEWEIDGVGNVADAASLAAAINAHSTIGEQILAESNTQNGIVVITARAKGSWANQVPFSSADGTITASAAFLVGGTGGAEGAAQSFSKT